MRKLEDLLTSIDYKYFFGPANHRLSFGFSNEVFIFNKAAEILLSQPYHGFF